jgi:hypothetical protein
MLNSVPLQTTSQVMSYFQEFSPTLNGTNPITNTTFTPYFVNCSNAFIDPVVNKVNNNGISILQSCVLDTACQKGEGCTAVCGKLGDTHIVTVKSGIDDKLGVDEKDQDRVFSFTLYNPFTTTVEEILKINKSIKSDSFKIHFGDKQSFESNLSQEDPKNVDEQKKLKDALNHFETKLKDIKPGATPQEGWSVGTGLAVIGGAVVGGGAVYAAQKVREKEQQNTTDNKPNRVPLSSRFSKE